MSPGINVGSRKFSVLVMDQFLVLSSGRPPRHAWCLAFLRNAESMIAIFWHLGHSHSRAGQRDEFLIVFSIQFYKKVYFSRWFLSGHLIFWYQIKPNISRCWQCSNINHKPTKNVVIVWTRIMIPNSYINSLSISNIVYASWSIRSKFPSTENYLYKICKSNKQKLKHPFHA